MALPALSWRVKLAYGMGELAGAVPVGLIAFFLLYFLTSVAGLSPAMAGGVLLLSRLWDGINDPLIGWLSDRTESRRWGRRYSWMIYGVGPLALCCTLLWVVPPVQQPWALFAYYGLLALAADVAFTAVQLPFSALAAELSDSYDERTSLIGYKSGFSMGGSILGLALAQAVFVLVPQPQQQYWVLGLLSGGIAIAAIALCVRGTADRYWQMAALRQRRRAPVAPLPSLKVELAAALELLQNAAFRQVLGLYLFAWMGLQMTAAMLPYFVGLWMNLPPTHFSQMALTVQVSAIAALAGWSWLGQRCEKRTVFLLGAPLTSCCLAALGGVQPGQLGWLYGLAIGVGLGLATLYLVPFAMLPDVIDLDELRTGQRREGLYFSAVVFLQKLGLAIALFGCGQALEWAGFSAAAPEQPVNALLAVRLLVGPVPALLVGLSLYFAWRYPISRNQHQAILQALQAKSAAGQSQG